MALFVREERRRGAARRGAEGPGPAGGRETARSAGRARGCDAAIKVSKACVMP